MPAELVVLPELHPDLPAPRAGLVQATRLNGASRGVYDERDHAACAAVLAARPALLEVPA
jgi:hypothetical protein